MGAEGITNFRSRLQYQKPACGSEETGAFLRICRQGGQWAEWVCVHPQNRYQLEGECLCDAGVCHKLEVHQDPPSPSILLAKYALEALLGCHSLRFSNSCCIWPYTRSSSAQAGVTDKDIEFQSNEVGIKVTWWTQVGWKLGSHLLLLTACLGGNSLSGLLYLFFLQIHVLCPWHFYCVW